MSFHASEGWEWSVRLLHNSVLPLQHLVKLCDLACTAIVIKARSLALFLRLWFLVAHGVGAMKFQVLVIVSGLIVCATLTCDRCAQGGNFFGGLAVVCA